MINLLRNRRSIRKYTATPVDKKSLGLLIETLLRSPSSRNIKPWYFIIIDTPGLLSQLSEAKEQGSQFLRSAALGIVVCADSTKSDAWVEDCSIASILVQVVAHSLGLGSCWIQIRNRKHNERKTSEQYIQKILGLPKHIKVESIMSIGHPAEIKKPIAERTLEYNRVRYNHYSIQYASVKKKQSVK
ncbi:MAG: nitroreductase family protein [Dissulfurispiraceae bacterium]